MALIGGFGSLTGEVDIWSLESFTEVGTAKSSCSIAIEWAPDGKTLMTAVYYERVKVDNKIDLFSANGLSLVPGGMQFEQVDFVEW